MFVGKVWPEDQWETAWFMNPLVRWRIMFCGRYRQQDSQRLQSVPGLAHTHVFAKPKVVPVTEKTTNHVDEPLSQ